MWLGLLYGISDDAPARSASPIAPTDNESAMVILYAWEAGRDRPLTVGCPLSAAPDMARLLREAGAGAPMMAPQCDACGVALDLPLE